MSHYKVDYKKLREKILETRKRREQDERFWRPPEGRSVVRFLPPWSSDGIWFREFGVHYRVGPDDAVITCPAVTSGRTACPVCRVVRACWKSGSEEDVQLARQMRLVHRYAANVVLPREDPSRVRVFCFGTQVLDDLNDIMLGSEDGEVAPHDFTDPASGRNIVVIREDRMTENGRQPQYSARLGKNVTPLPPEVLRTAFDLTAFFDARVIPDEEIQAALEGAVPPSAASEGPPSAADAFERDRSQVRRSWAATQKEVARAFAPKTAAAPREPEGVDEDDPEAVEAGRALAGEEPAGSDEPEAPKQAESASERIRRHLRGVRGGR